MPDSLDPTSSYALLADGRTVEVRPAGPADLDGLVTLHESMSAENQYLRFFGINPRFGRDVAGRICMAPELAGHALVAVRSGRIVGVAYYEKVDADGSAEIAVTVADDIHHRGVGTILIEHLAARAKAAGVVAFRADVLGRNHAMLRVLADAGLRLEYRMEAGVVALTIPLMIDDDAYLDAVAERERRADVESLRPLVRPQTVAVIGASRARRSIGQAILRSACSADFDGRVYAVNPHASVIDGVDCYPAVDSLPETPDLAVIAVPVPVVCRVAQQCGRRGVKALVVVTSGFDHETGARLLTICREYGMRLVGPNCFGIADTTVGLDVTFGAHHPVPGSAGVVVQSGGVGIALIEHLGRLGIGVSSFLSVGDKYDVSGNDALQWWQSDGVTTFGVLYLESFGNPRKFSRIARRLTRTMPLLTVLAGRSDAGQQAAVSHTAATVTSAVTREALFRQAGVITTTTLGELLDVAAMIGIQPYPGGHRVAVVSNAGGAGVLAADACADAGLEVRTLAKEIQHHLTGILPAGAACANPVDTTAAVDPETFARCLDIIATDENIDAVLAVTVPTALGDPSVNVRTIPGTPIAAVAIDQAEGLRIRQGVPWYSDSEAAARALARVADYATWQASPVGKIPQLADIDVDRAGKIIEEALRNEPPGGWLPAPTAMDLMSCYGIPIARWRWACTESEALGAAADIGGAVALKADVTGIVHKTDADAVALGLTTPEEVRVGYRTMVERFGEQLRGVLVQQMAPDGIELLAGVVQEPTFGPLVVFGSGGLTTDVLPDRAVRLAPLTDRDAAELVRAPRIAALFAGYRGRRPVDVPQLERILLRLSMLATDHPDVAEIDLNPVIARADDVVAVDSRVRVLRQPAWDPYLRRLR